MDISSLLSTKGISSDRVLDIAKAALDMRRLGSNCPKYFTALQNALSEEPPPFATQAYADIYRNASEEARWMATSLITAAQSEGDGARRLWSLAACCNEEQNEEQQLIKQHAVDESRHSLLYLLLLDLSFPGAVDPAFRRELDTLSPHYKMEQELYVVEGTPYDRPPSMDDFIQMNIAEIRTALHQTMQRQAVSRYCPAENIPKITRILDSLQQDELSHISYTAFLIEKLAEDVEQIRVSNLFRKRVRDFNAITEKELGEKKFD